METHLLAFTSNLLSERVLSKEVNHLLDHYRSNHQDKEGTASFLLSQIYSSSMTKDLITQMDQKFKKGILLDLDIEKRICYVYKYNLKVDLKTIEEQSTPVLDWAYNFYTGKDLGKISFVDKRQPETIKTLYESFSMN